MGVSGEWFCWNWSGWVKANPQTKIFGHQWGGRLHPVGGVLNPANPPRQIEHCSVYISFITPLHENNAGIVFPCNDLTLLQV